jgi:hypothetical protein
MEDEGMTMSDDTVTVQNLRALISDLLALLDRVVIADVYGTLYVGISVENGRGGWSVRVPDEARGLFSDWARDRGAMLANQIAKSEGRTP